CTPRPGMCGQSTAGYRSSGSLHPWSCSTGTQSVCIEPSEHVCPTDTAELVVAIAASSRVDGYTCGKSMTHGESDGRTRSSPRRGEVRQHRDRKSTRLTSS